MAVVKEPAASTLEIVPPFPRVDPIQHGLAIEEGVIALRAHELRSRRIGR
jgi:hypothetical protein